MEDDDEMLDNIKEVTIFPPVNACGNITDEDSGDEDVVRIENLPGSQLRAPAEIKLVVRQTEDYFSSDDDLPLSHFATSNVTEKVNKKATKKKKVYNWVKQDIVALDHRNLVEPEMFH